MDRSFADLIRTFADLHRDIADLNCNFADLHRDFADVNRDIVSALLSGDIELHKRLLLKEKHLLIEDKQLLREEKQLLLLEKNLLREEKQLLLLEKNELEVFKWKRQCCELTVELRGLKAEMEAKLVRAAQSGEARAEERHVAQLKELATELRSELQEVVREHFRSQNPEEEEEEEEERAPWRFRDLFKIGKKKPSPPPLRPATHAAKRPLAN